MKQIELFSRLGLDDDETAFKYFMSTLKPSNRLWSYYVNWVKVQKNTRALEVNLNILNYLLGKENFEEEFLQILREHPQVISALPALAVRDGTDGLVHTVLTSIDQMKLEYSTFDFSVKNPSEEQLATYLEFVSKSGVKLLFEKGKVTNLVDYIFGVEAGLDSNGRKNRGGKSMENIVESFVKNTCEQLGATYLKEATAPAILRAFDVVVPVDKSSRRYDFVIFYKNNLTLIEANYYGGGGSKLKATAGEYKGLQQVLSGSGFNFVWVTDGLGWKTAHFPLLEAFTHNDYTFNLEMLEQGALAEVVAGSGAI